MIGKGTPPARLGLLLALLLCACAGESWRGFRPYPVTEVAVRTPAFQVAATDGGLAVIVYEGRALPLVSVQIAIAAGAAAAPPGQAGLPQLCYELLADGTEGRDRVALAAAFDEIGATPQVTTGLDGAVLSVQVLAVHAERALQLLAEMVRRPRFATEDLEERRARLLEELEGRVGSPAQLGARALPWVIYGADHPYGGRGQVTPQSLRSLRVGDVRRFYARYVGPRSAAVVMTGQVTLADATAWAGRHLGDWRSAAEPPPPPPPPPRGPRRVVLVPKPGLVQTRIVLGRAAVAAGDAEEEPLRVAAVLYGDRLSWELREEQGLTYGATSGLQVLRGVGTFAVATAVQADATGPALREALDQLAQLRGVQLGSEDVFRARASAVWATLAQFRTIDGLGRAAAGLFFLRQPVDSYHQLVARMQALDRDRVEAALFHFLDPDAMHVVLVGDPAVITRQVGPLRIGPIEIFTPDGRPYE